MKRRGFGVVSLRQNQLFQFKKFLYADETFDVFAMTPSLATEAWRECQIAKRQVGLLENFTGMIGHHRHFSSARKIIIVLRFIEVLRFFRKMTGTVEMFPAQNRRRDERFEVFS